jgi:hypothetical protein
MSNFLNFAGNQGVTFKNHGTGGGTSFTLDVSASTNSVLLAVGGVLQAPGTDYTVSGTTVTTTTSVTAGVEVLSWVLHKQGTAPVIQDNSVTGAKIALSSQAAGDIMYYNGTAWVRLAKGTAGQVLAQNSGLTAPEWIAAPASGLIPLGKTTASAAASVESPTLSASYASIMVVGSNIQPSNDDSQLQIVFSDDAGSTYKSSSYACATQSYKNDGTRADLGNSSQSAITMHKQGGTEGIGNASTEGAGFTLFMDGHGVSGVAKRARWFLGFENAETTPKYVSVNGMGVWDGGTTAIDKIKFQMSSGTLSGVFEFFAIDGSV